MVLVVPEGLVRLEVLVGRCRPEVLVVHLNR